MAELVSTRTTTNRVLAATCISYTIVLLDASIVNVALGDISHTFGGGVTALQWIVNAYTLSFASMLLTGGTLGDRLGFRNIYLAGLSLFVFASILCGLAAGPGTLSAARALQGVGSAMLVPCSLALISEAFPAPAQRAAAVSIWMGCGGVAMASGPLIGGLLIHAFGWRSLFFVNVPVGLIGVFLTMSVEPGAPVASRHIDVKGQLAAILALGSLIGVLIEGHVLGWRSTPIVLGALLCAAAWGAFIAIESRTRDPMMPLHFFRNALFSASVFVSMASAFVFYGMLFAFSLWYQQVHGYTALATGLAFLPMTCMVATGGLFSSRIARRLGARRGMGIAFGLYTLGAAAMMTLNAGSPYWLAVAPMLAIGLAAGFISPAATSPAMGTVDANRAGVAAAVLNSARQSGVALGVAIVGTLLAGAPSFEVAMRLVLGLAMALCIAAALVWWAAARKV